MCQIDISRSLAARVGTHEAHVGVREGDTVRDVIERLASEYGTQVQTGMLDGERLRSDVIAVRNPDRDHEPVTAASSLEPGDTLEFHLTSEHDKVSGTA
ncbi:MoaD/ThiS family protein [Halorientalis salina]|uniref:MoaD/ThiS family protein n=1 Tax=Halorientalis salina TaxID=2932266 RepID=UPI0010AC7582|nr:MoaD/ThiS family protein [Halorientalis salina]